MFKPLALFIGLRYVRAKRSNHFISFISLVSTLGIGLGVAVLITVLSVMNGFDKELKTRILGMMPHVLVLGSHSALADWEKGLSTLEKLSGVHAVSPFVETAGMMSTPGNTRFVQVVGLDPNRHTAYEYLSQHMKEGDIAALKPGKFQIILGAQLAENLGVIPGEFVTIAVPETTLTPAGLVPRFKRFQVVGIFKVDYEYDASFGYIHLQDAQKLMRYGDNVTGLSVKLDNIYAAPSEAYTFKHRLPTDWRVYDWTLLNGTFFQAVKMEKTMMFVILTLIIAVAAFNILSMLVMVVTDKQSDIAILRTMGITPRSIIHIFMVQGSLIGFFGTIAGIVGGILLAQHVTGLVHMLEALLSIQFLSSDVYYISFLPSELKMMDVVIVAIISFSMSFFATLYPAWRASKTHPAEALRYE
ncbi:MAG: lipoprotein-releasing ABC transporter permease subunit [Gammaproteobacteria bacterium]